MKKLNKGIVLFLLGAILVGAVPTKVQANDNLIYSYYENNLDISLSKDLTKEQDFIEEIFRVIETTPDNKLENMSEYQLINYFNTKTEKIEFRSEDSKNSITPYGWWENTKCGDAILAVVGGTVFAGAKLLKLKKYIKALGGAKEAAYLVYLYFYYGELPIEGAKN